MHAFDGRLGCKTAAYRVRKALAPTLILGKEAVGLDHFPRFSREVELGGFQHGIDGVAQSAERLIQALEFRRRVVGDHALDPNARLVQIGAADREPFGEPFALEDRGPGGRQFRLVDLCEIDQRPLRDDFRQHHRNGRERLFFLFVVMTGRAVLHRKHAEDAFAAHDGNRKEGMKRVFAGFRAIGEARMFRRVRKIEELGRIGDETDKALALLQPGAMNGIAVEAFGGEELELAATPAQVNGTHFRDHIGRNQRDQLVEARLGVSPLRHDLAQAAQKNPGAACYELRRHQMAFCAMRRIRDILLISRAYPLGVGRTRHSTRPRHPSRATRSSIIHAASSPYAECSALTASST